MVLMEKKRYILDKDGDIFDTTVGKKIISIDLLLETLNSYDTNASDLCAKLNNKIKENDCLQNKVLSASMLCSALADIINLYYDSLDKNFPNLTKEDVVNIVFKVIKSDIDWFLFCNGIKK